MIGDGKFGLRNSCLSDFCGKNLDLTFFYSFVTLQRISSKFSFLSKYESKKWEAPDSACENDDGDVVVCSQIDERNEDWFHILRCISET